MEVLLHFDSIGLCQAASVHRSNAILGTAMLYDITELNIAESQWQEKRFTTRLQSDRLVLIKGPTLLIVRRNLSWRHVEPSHVESFLESLI